jgi:cytoskeletal protein RodZ
MIFSKSRSAPGMAFAVVIGFALALQTLPVMSQDQQQTPAEGDQAAPSDSSGSADTSAPAAEPSTEPSQDGTAAPAAEPSAEPAPDGGAPTAEPPADDAATAPPADNGAAEVAPAQPEAPAAETEQPAMGVNASQVQIGAAVFGSDGAKIGEVNGVKSDDTGKVQQILVTDGVPAGINAKVFEISADKITSVSDGVKLSLSSEEAKQLPVIDNSSG